MSYRRAGREWLWRNPNLVDEAMRPAQDLEQLPAASTFTTWRNFGGDKSWPAPQGWAGPDEWAGPPDDVLDGGAFEVVRHVRDSVRMTSGFDPRTGLRITRDIQLHRGGDLTVATTLVNHSPHVSEWAAWEVTQLAVPDTESAPANVTVYQTTPTPRIVNLLREPLLEHHVESLSVVIPVQPRVGKVGFPDCGGTIALKTDSLIFTQTFDAVAGARYPDSGSRAELWMQHPVERPLDSIPDLKPDAWLVELECLSPLTSLAPGGAVTLVVRWCVAHSLT